MYNELIAPYMRRYSGHIEKTFHFIHHTLIGYIIRMFRSIQSKGKQSAQDVCICVCACMCMYVCMHICRSCMYDHYCYAFFVLLLFNIRFLLLFTMIYALHTQTHAHTTYAYTHAHTHTHNTSSQLFIVLL